MFDGLKKSLAEKKLIEEKKKLRAKSKKEIMPTITVSTSSVCQPYDVIEPVMAIGIDKTMWKAENDLRTFQAFDKVNQLLKDLCFEMGGDAVINVQYDQRVVQSKGLFMSNSMMEIWAYGTVISFRE